MPSTTNSVENKQSLTRRNPLHVAIFFNEPEKVKELLDQKADINVLDTANEGHLSTLMRGAVSGNCEILKMLLAAKADIHQENISTTRPKEKHMTALMYAAGNLYKDAVIFLLDQGAHIKNSQGKSILDYGEFLTKGAVEKYISYHIAATQALRKALDDLRTPTDITSLICSYSRGFTLEAEAPTALTQQPNPSPSLQQPKLSAPIKQQPNLRPKKKKKAKKTASSKPSTTCIEGTPSTEESRVTVEVLATQTPNSLTTQQELDEIDTSTPHRRKTRCDCMWLRHTFFAVVTQFNPTRITSTAYQLTKRFF